MVIGENTLVAAGAIITKSIAPNSIAYGVNQVKRKNPSIDLVFSHNATIDREEIMAVDAQRVAEFAKSRESSPRE